MLPTNLPTILLQKMQSASVIANAKEFLSVENWSADKQTSFMATKNANPPEVMEKHAKHRIIAEANSAVLIGFAKHEAIWEPMNIVTRIMSAEVDIATQRVLLEQE